MIFDARGARGAIVRNCGTFYSLGRYAVKLTFSIFNWMKNETPFYVSCVCWGGQ